MSESACADPRRQRKDAASKTCARLSRRPPNVRSPSFQFPPHRERGVSAALWVRRGKGGRFTSHSIPRQKVAHPGLDEVEAGQSGEPPPGSDSAPEPQDVRPTPAPNPRGAAPLPPHTLGVHRPPAPSYSPLDSGAQNRRYDSWHKTATNCVVRTGFVAIRRPPSSIAAG